MPKCAYCLKDNNSTTFNATEHIIPYSLGRFTPLSPTLKGDLICDHCNSVVFNKIETVFKEDSQEGLKTQLFNIEKHSSIRLRGENIKNIEFDWGLRDTIFNQIVPVLKGEQGKIKAYPIPQIHLKNHAGVYQIFFIEALIEIKKKPKEFLKTKQIISKLRNDDILIFTGGKSKKEAEMSHKSAIALLKDFGKSYSPKENAYQELPKSKTKVSFEFKFKINKDTYRVLAKIAFNYFLYCLKQDKLEHLAFHTEFDNIRNFVLDKENIDRKNIIKLSKREAVLDEENKRNKRLKAHIIAFSLFNGKILVHLTLFGEYIYDILIGEAPEELIDNNFGCGHVFNPFTQKIHNIAQNATINPTSEQTKIGFGIFRRTL